MKDFGIKQKLSNEKGITLVALIITVVVMVLIVGVAISAGTESLDSTKLKGFYSELEIIQKRVDSIATTNESYVDEGETIYLIKTGKAYANLDTTQKNIINTEISGLNLTASKFRYFTKDQLNTILGLPEMRYNVFIDFESRTIIAEEGIEINGVQYRILKNNIYFSNGSNTNSQDVAKLELDDVEVKRYGSNNYKIIVKPKTASGQIKTGGTLRYKASDSKYWKVSDGFEIIVSEPTSYDIEYEDENKNKKTLVVVIDGQS